MVRRFPKSMIDYIVNIIAHFAIGVRMTGRAVLLTEYVKRSSKNA
jgi:hypothetical protein